MPNPEPGRRTLSPQQSEDIFYKYGSPTRRQAAAEGLPYHLDVEVHNRCPGSCLYCENSSEPEGTLALPRERLLQLIDEAQALGTRQILWNGGARKGSTSRGFRSGARAAGATTTTSASAAGPRPISTWGTRPPPIPSAG